MQIVVTTPGTPPVSVDNLRLHLSMNDTSFDELLEEWLQAANEYMTDATGFVPTLTTLTATVYEFPKDGIVRIPRKPFTGVTTVNYVGVSNMEYDIGFLTYTGDGVVKINTDNRPAEDMQRLEIQFTAGVDARCPARWKTVVRLLAAHWYSNREAFTDDLLSEVPVGLQAVIYQLRGALGVGV